MLNPKRNNTIQALAIFDFLENYLEICFSIEVVRFILIVGNEENEVLLKRPCLLELYYKRYLFMYQSYYDNDEVYQRPYIKIVQYMDIRISF